MKRLFFLSLFLLVSCSHDPMSVALRYLKAVQSNDIERQSKITCNINSDSKHLIQSAPSWTILGEEDRTIVGDGSKVIAEDEGRTIVGYDGNTTGSFHYNMVTVKIENRIFYIKVWKSDDIYKNHKNYADLLQKHGRPYEDLAPNRSQWSAEESCVSVGENY